MKTIIGIGFLLIIAIAVLALGLYSFKVSHSVSGDKFEIPRENILNDSGIRFLSSDKLDKGGPVFALVFEGEELMESVQGYKIFQNTEKTSPSIFSVLVYEAKAFDRFSSQYYDDMVYLKGDFAGASVIEDELTGYYRVTPNVANAARWVYFYSDPRDLDSKVKRLNSIVGECSSILPRYNLAKCTVVVENERMIVQINLSEVNIFYTAELVDFVLGKLGQWKVNR